MKKILGCITDRLNPQQSKSKGTLILYLGVVNCKLFLTNTVDAISVILDKAEKTVDVIFKAEGCSDNLYMKAINFLIICYYQVQQVHNPLFYKLFDNIYNITGYRSLSSDFPLRC